MNLRSNSALNIFMLDLSLNCKAQRIYETKKSIMTMLNIFISTLLSISSILNEKFVFHFSYQNDKYILTIHRNEWYIISGYETYYGSFNSIPYGACLKLYSMIPKISTKLDEHLTTIQNQYHKS